MKKSCAVGAAHLTCSSFADSTPPPARILLFIVDFLQAFICRIPGSF